MRNIIILIALATTSLSCGQLKNPENSDEHEHAADQQLTLFTDSSEFYVEFPELEAGLEAGFLVHLTRLWDYKPLASGKVIITLDYGDKISSASEDSPEIPGIWHIEFTPEYSGECRIAFEYVSESFSERSQWTDTQVGEQDHAGEAGGGSHEGEEAETHEAEAAGGHKGEVAGTHEGEAGGSHEGEAAAPEGIRFTKEQAWKSDFLVSLLKPSPFSGIIKAGGEILPMPGEKYFIHARTSGIVNYMKKNLVAGGEIRKAEQMMRIEGQDLAEGNIAVDFADSKTLFEQSRGEYERRLILFRQNAISEKQFIETRSAYISDSLRYYNLLQSFEGGGLIISSPISGHIHELNVSQGEYVKAGALIATVSSDLRLLLRADVSQQYYSKIGDIVSTNIRTSYQKQVIDIAERGGKLLAIGSSVAENHQYLPVYFEAENNGELLEGAYAEFFLKTRSIENCILVPVQSIVEEQGIYYVYVQSSGETYQKREIRLGVSDGFNYLVISGLSVGERVVSKGSMLLKAASMSSALPSDSHQH